jgi:hypothetical protein
MPFVLGGRAMSRARILLELVAQTTARHDQAPVRSRDDTRDTLPVDRRFQAITRNADLLDAVLSVRKLDAQRVSRPRDRGPMRTVTRPQSDAKRRWPLDSKTARRPGRDWRRS